MRIMDSESLVTLENANYKKFLAERTKVTGSVNIFCKYLLDNALNHGRYYYPSLNTLKCDNHLRLSSRTIDRLSLFLVEKGIFIKLPRSKSQPYQINLNNAFFRFVLAIYQPNLSNSYNYELAKIDAKRIEELHQGKNDLKKIINRLEFDDDCLLELHEELLDEFVDSNIGINKSNDVLKESLRSKFASYSYNITAKKFSVLNDFLQEEKRD